ncbi:hypothetical protein [Ignicoccus hospitalis]|uniref:Uncharacterized protein n=1 Tax=Ignicoccus hospitalis (strain KIN4/I / DSM 18386 / JCM 14125) TaxID=453591 RepID=A8A8J5_IGNH4|nr:hypothetical protein [Ignicoccus hospitalis]ABU81247.1 hypothetical protein Igni_0063 [Ignicoccus hospitalis KIN4/I]HIH90929.1 hypothetical protein [Desulfurococcaceae archaeon]
MSIDLTLLYVGIVLAVIVLNVAAYFLIYQSMISAYREATHAIISEYDKVTSLYLQLYIEYLKMLRTYLNATISNGFVPTSLPSPPSVSLPQLPLSITVSTPSQVSVPISSWPPFPPAANSSTT